MGIVTDEQLDQIVHRLVDGMHPEKIYLFGSHASGAARPGSDIDILIVVGDTVANVQAVYASAEKSLRGMAVPVEIVICTAGQFERQQHWLSSLSYTVARKGRLLYAA